jgi:hypothetical protein
MTGRESPQIIGELENMWRSILKIQGGLARLALDNLRASNE